MITISGPSAPVIVYNLFPTLAGPVTQWLPHVQRARDMGFTWLYLNPVQYPGFSGSLYAVKEHERLHPVLAGPGPDGARLETLRPVLEAIHGLGLRVVIDLVVNHVSRDSPLIAQHPTWFRRDLHGEVASPSVADPADTRRVTVWGDLAEVDNEASVDREGLWGFWSQLVQRGLDLGFDGFRCDAAYKVPAGLWERLTREARAAGRPALFVAETLGCRIEEVARLQAAGFDLIYNSSKWWDFVAPWCLEQHELFGRVAPSIAFPESHDTLRLAVETGGNEAVQRQRYAFAALFSAGVQMPMGYEFGFQRPLDVVKTRPEDWEAGRFDLRHFVRRVNGLKARHPLLHGEGVLRALPDPAPDVTFLRRTADDLGSRVGLILINRHAAEGRCAWVDPAIRPARARLFRPCRDGAPEHGEDVASGAIHLAPAEVVAMMEAT